MDDCGLLERDSELAAVEGLIADTPSGGRLLAIEGPPGIGKTALLAGRFLAQEAGMEVLGARGSEFERPFSYGVVRQLFEPYSDPRRGGRAGRRARRRRGAAEPLFDAAQLDAGRSPTRRWPRSTACTG